uniref:beta strand repeat-containing protein n=1 Tax=Flavobacterium sp. TaxID=239 RepID=UPI0038D4AFDB
MKKKLTPLLFIFLLTNVLFSQNLIVNGGFEIGGSGVGFVTNGAGYTLLNTPFSGTTTTGNFAFTTNPNLINNANFIPSSDHTSGNGKMLIIDGNTTAGNPRFWKAGNTGAGITTLTIGTTYRFSYWIKSVSTLVTGPASQADINIALTGGSATLVAGTALAPLPALGWRHVVYSFTATATTATIELWNTNTSASGNDFAVDDFMLTDDLMVTYNVTDALCATASDGSITVSGLGGTLPYTNYTITGPVTLNNATGVFTGVPPGIYTVSITDSALPTATTVSMGNVVVGPSLTITPSSSAVCIGSSTTITATGSSNPYTWTATPAATAGLTTPGVPNPTVTPTAAVVHTYTASSTIGACTVTKSINITVNPLPTANITGNATICPGNTAVITITGTPSSSVTLTNNLGNTYAPFIPASGTLLWTTPILNVTTLYTLESIKNFATGCQRNYSGVTVTITVVPNGCATVKADPAVGSAALDLTLCTTGECRTLQANISPIPSTTTYGLSSIPYCPQSSYVNSGAPWQQLQNEITGDDKWSAPFNFPGAGPNTPAFQFCFFGNAYSSLNVGSNGVITFDPRVLNSFCQYSINQTVPNPALIRNAIYGVYQDINFDIAICPTPPLPISCSYAVIGTYPCRKFILNFANIPMYEEEAGGCPYSYNATAGLQTSQIVLYEISNIIEVYVERRVPNAWQNGAGVIGIQNQAGTLGYSPTGRNTGNWSANQEAWRFTPNGPNVPVQIDWLEGSIVVGTGPTVTVCPNLTTTYTLRATYQVCGLPQTATSSVTLNVNPDLTNSPVDITQCTNTFNLTTNEGVILGSLTGYNISYHLTAADAATGSNPIINSNAFVSSGQTIYVRIFVTAYGCTVVKPFNLIISCGAISPVPDLTLCESSSGSGSAVFDLTPQTAIALGSQSASDYTFTYYTSLAAANAGTPGTEINPINSFVGTNQTIYIRMQSNAVPTTFYTTDFDLIVNPLPTATISGTTTICSGTNAVITFTGTPGATVNYTVDGNAAQIPLNAGTATVTTPNLALSSVYQLVSVLNPATNCSRNLTGSATVTVRALPTATISGTTAVCKNSTSPNITFTGANGTAPYTFTYSTDGGTTLITTPPSTGNIYTLPVSTAASGVFTYTLISVQSSGVPACSQNQSGTATVTVSVLPTAAVSGTTTVCRNAASPSITFTGANGTAPYTFTYTTDGGITTVTTPPSVGNTYTIPVSTATTGVFTYTLISVQSSGVPACSQNQSGSAIVTVNALPTATISGTTTVCKDSASPNITFTGTNGVAPYTFTYSTDGGTTLITTPPSSGNTYLLPASTASSGATTYTLISVQGSGIPACSQNQSGTATVTVSILPTATISGTTSVCRNAASPSITFTGANGTAPYTFTYSTDGGTTLITTPPSIGNTYTIPVSTATAGAFTYTLISVQSSGVPACSQNQSGTATVTVKLLPSATISGTTAVCLNSISPQITLTGANGTSPYTFTYSINTLVQPPVSTTVGNSISINAPTASQGVYTYALLSVQDGASPSCSQTQSGSAVVTVNNAPTINTPTQFIVCDDSLDNLGFYCGFDLTTKDVEITSDPTVVITYHETQTDADIGGTTIPIPTSYCNLNPFDQTIFVRAYFVGSSACYSTTSFHLIVNPIPLPNPVITDYELCDYNNTGDGIELFNLGTKSMEIANGQTGVTV